MFVPDLGDASFGGLSVRFWGVRGSYPTPGPLTLRYGGNTPCVEVRIGDRLLIIDAGSGFVKAGEALFGRAPERIDLLLSHLHHDHVSGLPFFGPALARQCSVRTFCGNLGGESAAAALNTLFSPPLFPVSLDVLPVRYEHVGFRAGETLDIDDVTVATCPLFHPGGATGYRFDHGGRRVCYISDIEHSDPWPAAHLVRFCQDADLVIFDSMYSSKQYAGCRGWGHSTLAAGIALCRAASARAMAGFHHNPVHDDDKLDAMQEELVAALPGSFMAREGQTVAFAATRRKVAPRVALRA